MKNWICAVILVISLSFSGTCLSSQSSGLNAIFNGQKPDIKLVKEKLSLLTEYTTGKFKDIRSTDWFCPGTSKLVGMGGVEGYTDGTFKPQNPIKVSEFVKLLLSSMGYKEENHPQVWYKNYVDKATALGVIEPSDAYAYESGMKRMDMAKMICRILNIQPKKSPAPVFSDTSGIDTSWIDTAFSEYLIRGYYSKHSRTFKPTQTASRAEVCEMIVRALEYRDNPAEYKRYMAAHFAEAEKRQDDLDDGALQNINGFVTKVPGRNSALPQISGSKKPDHNNPFIFIVIDIIRDNLNEQYNEVESLLLQKFDKSTVDNAMVYIKQKKDYLQKLDYKAFEYNSLKISINSSYSNQCIGIGVYSKKGN